MLLSFIYPVDIDYYGIYWIYLMIIVILLNREINIISDIIRK